MNNPAHYDMAARGSGRITLAAGAGGDLFQYSGSEIEALTVNISALEDNDFIALGDRRNSANVKAELSWRFGKATSKLLIDVDHNAIVGLNAQWIRCRIFTTSTLAHNPANVVVAGYVAKGVPTRQQNTYTDYQGPIGLASSTTGISVPPYAKSVRIYGDPPPNGACEIELYEDIEAAGLVATIPLNNNNPVLLPSNVSALYVWNRDAVAHNFTTVFDLAM